MTITDPDPGDAIDPRATAAAQDAVLGWRAAIAADPALAALAAFNARMGRDGLGPAAAHAFIASLYQFNRATPAGIAGLAARWADHLAATDPFGAPAAAATLLAAAVDEFGLTGTRPHVVVFADFGLRWGVTRPMLLDAAAAVPAARELGQRVERWYRDAPLGTALAVHFVSEETSTAEFAAWYALFPDAEYTRVHAALEPGHSSDAGQALAHHLALHPEDLPLARDAIAPYLAGYGAMWRELAALLPPISA